MKKEQPNNPLHGIKLHQIVVDLYTEYGWDGLHATTGINVFVNSPTVNSSLKMLRRTPWARERIETLYLDFLDKLEEASTLNKKKEE